ncbi:hypothetical protein DPMN_042969 [Dreissena polymorpha]|uniref:MAM domain-containing protein n=1 Tax=Dreissena polymorpha TaxID=45954 RepID=A0A9D4HZ86_DREPO|nr:hypothetical protein DPMN_042969 [Dreissena polymorpha]
MQAGLLAGGPFPNPVRRPAGLRALGQRLSHLRQPHETQCRVDWRSMLENTLCGFKNVKDKDLDWKVIRPLFSGNATSPYDHKGNYLQAESSRLQAPGDIGRITVYASHGNVTSCLTFDYRLDGGDLIQFKVYRRPIAELSKIDGDYVDVNGLVLLMSVKGTNENAWNKTQVRVDEDHDCQLIFEAALVNEIGSRVAIDDVMDASVYCDAAQKCDIVTVMNFLRP